MERLSPSDPGNSTSWTEPGGVSCSKQRDSEGITRTASLSQPRCQDESCQAGEVSSLVSLEHDTITSLRQFLKTAQRGRERTWAENNIMPGAPGALFHERSEAGPREASRQSR